MIQIIHTSISPGLFIIWAMPCYAMPCQNVSRHMRTAKAQLTWASAQSVQSLHCPQTESLDSTECFNGAKALMNFEHVQDDVNPHILRTFESIFSLDMANISQNHEKRHIQTCAPSNKLNQRAYPCNRLCCLPEQNLDCWLSKENQTQIDKSV